MEENELSPTMIVHPDDLQVIQDTLLGEILPEWKQKQKITKDFLAGSTSVVGPVRARPLDKHPKGMKKKEYSRYGRLRRGK